MGELIDGRAIAEKIQQKTAMLVKKLKTKGITPHLGVILVGKDQASVMYDKMKGAAAEKVGIKFTFYQLNPTISKLKLIAAIHKIQADHKLSGLIIQLPLPEKLYIPEVLNAINPNIDVDFLTEMNMGKLIMNTTDLLPPTPGAVISILDELKINPNGKNITIIGTGALVGKPLATILINRGASVTTCNSRTKNITAKCLAADIIVTGVGKKDILRGNMVSPGAVVIDAGVSFYNKKVYGDINREEVLQKASFVTPTPGGVGPITVANLLWNTALCANKNKTSRT